MDVIYTGLHRSSEDVVNAAIQEDVDVIGVSMLSGAHMTHFPRILNLLKEKDATDIIVIGGGVIPDADAATLRHLALEAKRAGLIDVRIAGDIVDTSFDRLDPGFPTPAPSSQEGVA